MLMKAVHELIDYREFLASQVQQQLRQRYQGSILGFLWTLLNPLLVFASFTLIFSQLNRSDIGDYGMYFFSGYLMWNLFANSATAAAESVVGNPAYVTRTCVPKAVFPLAAVAINAVDLTAGFAIVLAIAAFLGRISWTMFFIPVAAVITLVFVAGIAFLCAWCNVFLRDFRHLLASFLFLWFFFSPILWKASAMPGRISPLVNWNPIVPFLRLFQGPIWGGVLPTGTDVGITIAISAGVFFLGLVLFVRSESEFYYYL
jgi:lipopolysaccharide transport system permease protein